MTRIYKILVLPGDGIGPETIQEALKVLQIAAKSVNGLNLSFHEYPCGGKYYLKTGLEWPQEAKEFGRDEADAILLGAIGWEKTPGEPVRRKDGQLAGTAVVLEQRRELELYANMRPVKLYPGIPTPLARRTPKDIDFVIIRENTEGLYVGIGARFREGEPEEMAIDMRPITRQGAKRVIRFAFNLSQKRERGAPSDQKQRVTCVDKSNVLQGDQLFRKVFLEMGTKFVKIEKDLAYVDAWTMWCVRRPDYYDVVVTPNLYGDIISDLGAAIQGGMGVAAGGNIGETRAMFEPIHGSAPRHAGKQRANPIAAILAGKMLLDWLAEKHSDKAAREAALKIEQGVVDVLKKGEVRTYDLCIGPYAKVKPVSTVKMGSAIVKAIQSNV